MNPSKNEDSAVPKGWILCSSKSNPGRKYYFNRKTGKSSWTKPQADESPKDLPNKKKKIKEKDKEQMKAEAEAKAKIKETPHKNLKRKSDGSTSQSTESQNEVPTTSKQNKTQKMFPVKKPDTSIPAKTTPTPVKKGDNISRLVKKFPKLTAPKLKKKNFANTRMAQLRSNLCNESIEEDNSSIESLNTSQTETKSKELKSPNINDSKTSTQSPNNDQAASPSQFFAANKIISAMKAQLQEEYSHTQKPKDSFADIEEGICSQVTEYPYMKHPVTPPQFSEASKLVTAIKSKLSYKASKETPAQFSSAKDRLEFFRRSLGSEGMEKTVERLISLPQECSMAMDVDMQETKPNVPVKDNVSSSKENLVLVVDTNIFIQELDFIKNVMNSHIKGFSEPPTLLVPWRVISELDKLKDSNNGAGAVCKRARPAMNYLYKYLPENNRIKVQSLRDANSHIYPCECPDDEILNCCLQQSERGKSVILLSNDKNLCTKALANGVQNKKLNELELEQTSQPRAPPDEPARVQKHIYTLLANILENEMRAKYSEIWLRVVAKSPPWSLADVLHCLLKHWIAVFNEVFPRIEHLITELNDSLLTIEKKASKNITEYELSNFKDLCLDVAKHCQIIPEYMELAKKTVVRLQRDRASESEDESEKDGDNVVIEAFEGVWTVFSSYCAKLASGLGIPHTIDDKLPSDDSFDVLTSKLYLFGNHISELTMAIGGVLTENASEQELEEHVSRLESSFKESLAAIGVDGAPVTDHNLRLFATKCRIMLQEAHSKFAQLVELLQICKNRIELST